MAPQRPPALAERSHVASLESPPHEPLARAGRADLAPAAPPTESPLPLDGGTLALSLPIAICLGQLNVPAAAAWTALLILYKAATAPGVARGTLDALVDGLSIEGRVRERLGVPPRVPKARQRPASSWEAPVVAVRGWKAAVAARRGEALGEGQVLTRSVPVSEDAAEAGTASARPRTGTTTQLPSLASVLEVEAPMDPAPPAIDTSLSLDQSLARLPAVLPIRELALDPRPLAVPLGMTPEGEVRWVDLAEDVVNVGVYGTTGAGKDLLLLQWFVLLCRRNRPEDVQFIVLDGKGDWLLPQLKGLAHMRVDPAGGYGNVEAVKAALDTIHQEARSREQLIFGSGHRSREHYIAATGKPLPLLVVIVTDLMTTVQGYVEEELAELISKARALGIRVVMSFQNPTGKDMGWRSNIGLVLAGCMVDGSQDPVVLGIRRLTDMRYRPSQLPNPKKSDPSTKGLFVVRHGSEQLLVKTPYLDDDALLRLCARLPRRMAAAPTPEPAPPATPRTVVMEAEKFLSTPIQDELLAALLRQTAPATAEHVQAQRRRRWPAEKVQERRGGRKRGGVMIGRRERPQQPAVPAPEPPLIGSGDRGLPPQAVTGTEQSEDDRLYRMMLVPLSFNQIYKAVGSDRNTLLKRCQRIRENRKMGSWPKKRSKLDRATLLRMAEVPMGFNEVYRALGGGRTELSKLWREVIGQTDMDGLDEVRKAVS